MTSLATTVSRKASALIPSASSHELNSLLLKSKRVVTSVNATATSIRNAAKADTEWCDQQEDDIKDVGEKVAGLQSLLADVLSDFANKREESRRMMKDIR